MKNAHPCLNACIKKVIYHQVGCQTLMYSTNRFRKAIKCSAFLILPGIASFSRSSGSTISIRCELDACEVAKFIQGFPINPSVSFWSVIDSCNPSTSFAYSSWSLATSLVLILFWIRSDVWKKCGRGDSLFNFLGEFGYTTTSSIHHRSCKVNA